MRSRRELYRAAIVAQERSAPVPLFALTQPCAASAMGSSLLATGPRGSLLARTTVRVLRATAGACSPENNTGCPVSIVTSATGAGATRGSLTARPPSMSPDPATTGSGSVVAGAALTGSTATSCFSARASPGSATGASATGVSATGTSAGVASGAACCSTAG